MSLARLLISALVLLPLALPVAAQTDKPKPPKKGDTLIVKGCLRGNAVEGAQAQVADVEGERHDAPEVPVLTYRLQGKKELLKELKDKHDRRIVEVTGVLRSELSGSGIGTSVGRTRITIGVDPRAGRTPQGSDQAVPVLEVTSFAGTDVSCGR